MTQKSENIWRKLKAVMFYIIGFFVVAIIALVVIGFIWGETVGRVNARRLKIAMKPFDTYAGLISVAKRCDTYKEQYGNWPTSLVQVLPLIPEMKEWTNDSWGRSPVLVTYNSSLGYGEVISYGQDGKPGGTAADADIIVRFPLTGSNAVWDEQVGGGLVKPERMQPWSNWFYGLYDIERPADH